MKKKGQIGILYVILVVFVIGLIWLTLSMIPTGECKKEVYILKGVNGITDENNGLFSSGDVSKTSLLMQNGRIITVNYRINDLFLNKPITVKKCKMLTGYWDTNIIQ